MVRNQVGKELRDIKHYATTTDLWSSRTMDPYISLTVHDINDDWKLCSKCLQTSYVPDDHTGELIARGLREALESWELAEELQVCITTDNGANVVKAVGLNDLLDMASFIDPWFKISYIADNRKDYIKTKAVAEMQALTAAAEVGENKKVKRSLGSFFKKASIPGPAALADRDAIEIELQSYLQALDVDGEADPLEWLELHQANVPRVASLARKYLCIPATSAPSERAFSTGGNIVTCHRAAVKPENVDRLVFLAKNLP
ncbi:hypothetical protein ACEWY4_001740 [Coilia grayii]|uniref:HAT C-terminal dimerisation domain-containing protein n=1 Tax=Coilia grayii TaxID=363190 RepID=A0ABD1KTV4_9TELE